jgi:DNA-binding LacI/PurR family transcriptional regulator
VNNRVTLKQVAVDAGVSYQTVSKVINRQVQVSKETEERIWSSVCKLGYHPNRIARSLRSKRSRMIGYSWFPTPSNHPNPVLDQFLQGMLHAAENAGYYLLCFPHHFGPHQLDLYQDLIDTNLVDAFAISGVEFDDDRIKFLTAQKFPFVAFGRSNQEWLFPCVDVDSAAGMGMVVSHLVERGHRAIAALAWPEESRVGQERMNGFLQALGLAGITPQPDWIARGVGGFDFGYQCAAQWLARPPQDRPTAIVCFNDMLAIGAMHAAQQLGLQVGRDVAITGFDDTPLVEYLEPSLTSVRQPSWSVGEQVVELLVDLLEHQESLDRQVLLQPRLIVRRSSCDVHF